jgi:hypothetical protein
MTRPPSRRCSAKSRRSGEQCRSYAIVGGTVCWHHGGRLPGPKAAAAREVATREAYQRAAEQTRDPARIAAVAAEALLRKAEQTGDPGDYERASIAAKRAAEVAAALRRDPGGGHWLAGGEVTIDDDVRRLAAELVDLEREQARREEAGGGDG